MTCIVAIAHKGKVHIGGDSAGVGARHDVNVRVDKKVFKNGDYIMGFCGSFRMGQLLAYKFIPPEPHPDRDMLAFMVTDFVDAVRDCLKHGGFSKISDNEESGGDFIVGYKGHLFHLFEDFQVQAVADDFDAAGIAAELALGSLHSTRGKAPKERILKALSAAEHFSAAVKGPFTVLST